MADAPCGRSGPTTTATRGGEEAGVGERSEQESEPGGTAGTPGEETATTVAGTPLAIRHRVARDPVQVLIIDLRELLHRRRSWCQS